MPPAERQGTNWKVLALAIVGLLCIQTAWALVVPPFRGLDEHDHAYKAAAVASGDWSPRHENAPRGWGELVEVPTDLVVAAKPVCEYLPYTRHDNCYGAGQARSGVTAVASTAARYNPVFYAVVGTIARPFHGAHALYAMRAGAVIMCALLAGLAVATTVRWSRTHWPGAALILTLTPMVTYSMTIAAPNGVELASALLVWCALLGIARCGPTVGLAAMATIGAMPLVVVRGMGPIWLLLVVATVALLVPGSHWLRILRSRSIWIGASLVLLATLYAGWWILASGGADVGTETKNPESPWPIIPINVVLWFFQSMAAFPTRSEMAHLSLYIVGFFAWAVMALIGLRMAQRRERLALGIVVVVGTALPVAITVLTYRTLGTAWQGRYAYPFTMGFMLICGYALDRSLGPEAARSRWPVVVVSAVTVVISLIGQLGVLADPFPDGSLGYEGALLRPEPLMITGLNVVGFGLLALALTRRRGTRSHTDSLPQWTGSPTTGSISSDGPAVHS